jgi:hypothetical protein
MSTDHADSDSMGSMGSMGPTGSMGSMGSDSTINPFELLGLTIDSSVEESRAAFRGLALLAHPDKGGRPDEMRALLNAFRYVERQLKAVNRTTTVEDLERQFKEFSRTSVSEDIMSPWIRDLIIDPSDATDSSNSVFDIDRFNELFEMENETRKKEDGEEEDGDNGDDAEDAAEKKDTSPIVKFFDGVTDGYGYGDSMLPSENISTSVTYEKLAETALAPPAPIVCIPMLRRPDKVLPNTMVVSTAYNTQKRSTGCLASIASDYAIAHDEFEVMDSINRYQEAYDTQRGAVMDIYEREMALRSHS